jgi:YidC/Oxa1 family membrane protein insertase
MERRVLLSIFLSFLVIYAWQALFVKPVPKPPAGQTSGQTPVSPPSAQVAESNTAAPGLPASTPTPAPPAAAAVVGESGERNIRVETKDVLAVFSNRGARLKSWRLKGYQDGKREPLELITQTLPPGQPLPFSLRVDDKAVTDSLNSALYAVSGAPSSPETVQVAPVRLKFEYQDTSGVHAIKEFDLEPSSFVLTLRANVTAGDRALTPTVQWGPALGDSEMVSRFAQKPEGLISIGGKEQRLAPPAIAKQPTYEGELKFAGVDDHYFLTVALDPGRAKVTFAPVVVPPPAGTSEPPRELMAYSIEPVRPDQTLKFYIGPKDFDQLARVDRDLVRAINFGIFTIIVVPLLRSLKWINGFVGNYGWSILALTAFINLIILPLRHKSVVSMRKMQEIQPEAKAIQDRYAKLKASDPAKQKMNQELMALYKERGVNPASGCVPMLLPFPILIAFYSLLTTAIELRGAPFMLWIHDLSLPDPYYVTPILMGASQLWQQWLAPAAGVDPVQRKMMMVMPVIFTYLFISYPSGVALYWLASNVWAIGQQYATNYLIGPPKIRTPLSAGERRMKRVGGGRTDAAAREN